MATSFDKLISTLEKERQDANVANQKRYEDIMKIYDDVIASYAPGGTFEKAQEAQLDRTRQQSLARGTQSLVQSGLANTTIAAGLPTAFEESVGTPFRTSMQDLATQRRLGALEGKAGVIERVSDEGPDYSTIASLAMQAGQQPSGRSYSRVINSSALGGMGFSGFPSRSAPKIKETEELTRKQARPEARTEETRTTSPTKRYSKGISAEDAERFAGLIDRGGPTTKFSTYGTRTAPTIAEPKKRSTVDYRRLTTSPFLRPQDRFAPPKKSTKAQSPTSYSWNPYVQLR